MVKIYNFDSLCPIKQELIEIADQFEEFDAKRLEALLQLAQLRDIGLDELLKHMTQPSASH